MSWYFIVRNEWLRPFGRRGHLRPYKRHPRAVSALDLGASCQFCHHPHSVHLSEAVDMGSWDLLSLRHCFHAVYLDSYPDFRGDYTLDYPKKFKIPTRIINLHQIFGIVAFSLVSLVTILGIFIQVYKIFKGRSKEVVLLKKIHRIAGYIVLVMCKTNSLIITFGGGDLFTILLVVDIATTILIVTWKIFFPKLEARQTSHKVEEPLLTVASLKDLDP